MCLPYFSKENVVHNFVNSDIALYFSRLCCTHFTTNINGIIFVGVKFVVRSHNGNKMNEREEKRLAFDLRTTFPNRNNNTSIRFLIHIRQFRYSLRAEIQESSVQTTGVFGLKYWSTRPEYSSMQGRRLILVGITNIPNKQLLNIDDLGKYILFFFFH